ncbi:MAG: hypothetical protein M3R13_05310 [Armatimonadota bacterium]|nr:hypothetical protein [Armatimonadota bacterium]
MLKTKPEDTPKIIALAVAIIAVFAYVLYSFMRGSGETAGTPSTSSVAASAPSSNQLMGQPFASTDPTTMSPGGPTPDAAAQAESLLADNSTPPPMTVRDPFRSPVGGPPASGQRVGDQYNPRNIPRPAGGIPTQVGNIDPGSIPMPVAPPPASELELKGVVSGGSRPMALLRIGNTLLNVYEGQKITKDLVVKKIGIASVQLRHMKDSIQLEVGTMLMANVVLPEWLVQSNPSVQTEAPASGDAIEMPATAAAAPVYAAPPQDLQGSTPVAPQERRYGPI